MVQDISPRYHIDNNVIEKITKTYADFSAAATGNTIEIYESPNDVREIIAAYADCTTYFAGGGSAVATVEVGISSGASSDEIIAPQSVATTGKLNALGTYETMVAPKYVVLMSGRKVYARLEADVNLDQLTQGSIDIYLIIVQH